MDLKCEFVLMNSDEAESVTGMISGADSAIAVCSPSAIAPNNPHEGGRTSSADIHPPKDTSFPTSSPLPKVTKKPNQAEIDSVADELKYLRINPEVCMGVVQKYWGNVGGAIARVKEAIRDGWCQNATGLFIASCKKGVKPEKKVISDDVSSWFNWVRAKRVVIAMTDGWVYTLEGKAVRLEEMMCLYPIME